MNVTTQFPPHLSRRRLALMVALLLLNLVLIAVRFDSFVADLAHGELSPLNLALALFMLGTTLWVGLEAETRFTFRAVSAHAS